MKTSTGASCSGEFTPASASGERSMLRDRNTMTSAPEMVEAVSATRKPCDQRISSQVRSGSGADQRQSM